MSLNLDVIVAFCNWTHHRNHHHHQPSTSCSLSPHFLTSADVNSVNSQHHSMEGQARGFTILPLEREVALWSPSQFSKTFLMKRRPLKPPTTFLSSSTGESCASKTKAVMSLARMGIFWIHWKTLLIRINYKLSIVAPPAFGQKLENKYKKLFKLKI